jgi:DNA-binding NtrC family response regulator
LGTSPRVQGTGAPTRAGVADKWLARPWHIRCDACAAMNAYAEPAHGPLAVAGRSAGYHTAVCDFKRRLIEATLLQMRGNRTHTARALGLQRTYLLRLMRELRVAAPPPPARRRTLAG